MKILEINDPKSIGQTMKAIRLEQDIHQADAARAMNMLPETLSRIERGIKAPSFSFMYKAAKYYGIDEVRLEI